MINLDFNKLPFGPRGALGAWQEAQNAFARAKAERHGQEILNAFNAQQNPQRVKELALSNAFNEENNPLKLEEARQQNEWRPQLNQSTLNSQAANTEATRLNNDLSRDTNPFKAREAKRQAEFNAFADPYARQQAEIDARYYEPTKKADIRSKNATADWRSSGGMGGGVAQKAAQYAKNVVLNGRPDLSPLQQSEFYNAMLAGEAEDNNFSDGSSMPAPTNEELAAISDVNNKTGGGKALTGQAVQLQTAAEHIGEIPLDALKAFAGPTGKARFLKEQTKELAGGEVSNEYQEYKNYRDNIATLNMDALRKAYGTSVVPEYVFSTIGNLMNPSLDYLNSPAQVEKNVRALQEYVNEGAQKLGNAARFGLAAQNKNKSTKKSEGKIRVISPKGVTGSVPSARLKEYLANGYHKAD